MTAEMLSDRRAEKAAAAAALGRRIVTAGQQRAIEREAVLRGLSEDKMMEEAGFGSAELLFRRYALRGRRVLVLCGSGGNGGDGYALARRLKMLGAVPVCAVCFDGGAHAAARRQRALAEKERIPLLPLAGEPAEVQKALETARVIVDAVYGVGFHGRLPEEAASLFVAAGSAEAARVSLDLPSGMEADGRAADGCFRPELTLCYVAPKPAHVFKASSTLCGTVEEVDIGIPKAAYEAVRCAFRLEADELRPLLRPRSPTAHKGSFGRVLCRVGSANYRGAAVLCAAGAVRTGAGIVEIVSEEPVLAAVAAHLPEPILLSDASPQLGAHLNAATAMVLGCGLSETDGEQAVQLFDRCRCPAVIDATGIKLLQKRIQCLEKGRSVVITPHPSEFSRLTGLPIRQLCGGGALGAAADFAKRSGCFVVLKGANTVIAAPDGRAAVNTTGNPGLAKGGSGDLLAGMIGALLGMGLAPFDAASLGVWLHGTAADLTASECNEYSMTPWDVSLRIGCAIDRL